MSIYTELGEFLQTEVERGFTNTTSQRGAEQFVQNWAQRKRNDQNSEVIDEIAYLIEGYDRADLDEREMMIEATNSVISRYDYDASFFSIGNSLSKLQEPNQASQSVTSFETDYHSTQRPPKVTFSTQSETASEGHLYPVRYRAGHSGIDHFLQTHFKKKGAGGRLVINSDGIEFIGEETITPKVHKFLWDDIRMSDYERVGIIFRKTLLHVSIFQHGRITFESEDAKEIAKQIKDEIGSRERERERLAEEKAAKIERLRLGEVAPRRFEELVAELFKAMGYRVSRIGQAGDEGIDLVCWDSESNLTVVQCKRYTRGKITPSLVRDFYGALMHRSAKHGYLVTTSDFTAAAKSFANGKPITLVDGRKLRQMFSQHMPL